MNYLSVCSGIEAATLAWSPDWKPLAFSEIDAFPNALLKHYYPHVPNLGDMTKYKEWNFETDIDVLVGGTPCQSYSIAGLRAGLDDPRGELMLTFGAIARRLRPKWIIWENVDSVLSSNGGRDFGTFLGMLGECGYGTAYRVLNAQYFGVPQRRRRVFVIGYLGDWRPPAAVLFERHRLQGHTSPSYEPWKEDPSGAEESARGYGTPSVSMCINTRNNRLDLESQTPIPLAFAMRGREGGSMPELQGDKTSAIRASSGGYSRDIIAFSSKDYGADATENISPTMRAGSFKDSHQNGGVPPAIAWSENSRAELRTHDVASCISSNGSGKPGQGRPVIAFSNSSDLVQSEGFTPTITTRHGDPGNIALDYYLRRLTPLECERLQDIPDNYTLIDYRGKPAKDTPRYKGIGNSIAIPCLKWIKGRIEMVGGLMKEMGKNR